MSNYKLIATDLDGTLLDNRGELSRENLMAMKDLRKKGVKITLSTGRTLLEIPSQLKHNESVDYLIGSNGAVVWDLKTQKVIVDLTMPQSVSQKIFDILSDFRVNITYRYKGQSYVDKNDFTEENLKFYNICKPHENAVKNYAVFSEDFKNFSYSLENIETFALFFHDFGEMEECEKRFSEISDLSVVRAWDYNLEVFYSSSGKGNALKKLAEFLGISIGETIAVGDSNNDTSMVEAAGLGLCVSNGVKTLKEKADRIICSNEEHIIKYIFENFA